MESKPQFSIIIPVYNGEKFLNRCILSVLNQNYDNYEVIFVNDGSTDNSAKLCDDWSQKDSRIKVVHQKNAGLPRAREVGVINANGEYIMFIDVDDWIANGTLQDVYETARKTHADVIFDGFVRAYRLPKEHISYRVPI